MIRALTLILLAAGVAATLLSLPGEVRVEIFDWLIIVKLGAVLAAMGLAYVAYRMARHLIRTLSFTSFRQARQASRIKAQVAAAQVASAAGRHDQGLAILGRLPKGDHPPAVLALMAEAALAGDQDAKAAEVFDRMLATPATRFLGLQGHVRLALKQGDVVRAQDLAAQAFQLEPGSRPAADAALALALGGDAGAQALAIIDKALRAGAYDRALARRRRALVHHARARALVAQGTLSSQAQGQARDFAVEAYELAPDHPPFAVLAAHLEERGRAAKILTEAYGHKPHPSLVAEAQILGLGVEAVTAQRPDHGETALAKAEFALSKLDLAGAKAALEPFHGELGPQGASARIALLMARVTRELAAGGEAQARHAAEPWFAQALAGPRDDRWCCTVCGEALAQWVALCPRCGTLDQFTWPDLGRIKRQAAAEASISSANRVFDDPGLEAPKAPVLAWSWLRTFGRKRKA